MEPFNLIISNTIRSITLLPENVRSKKDEINLAPGFGKCVVSSREPIRQCLRSRGSKRSPQWVLERQSKHYNSLVLHSWVPLFVDSVNIVSGGSGGSSAPKKRSTFIFTFPHRHTCCARFHFTASSKGIVPLAGPSELICWRSYCGAHKG